MSCFSLNLEGRKMARSSWISMELVFVAPLSPNIFMLLRKKHFSPFRCLARHPKHSVLVQEWEKYCESKASAQNRLDYALLFNILSEKGKPLLAEQVFLELKSEGFVFDVSVVSNLMLCYAENGFLCKARVIWDEMMAACIQGLNVDIVTRLFNSYGKVGFFDQVVEIVDELESKGFNYLFPDVYTSAVACLGSGGRLDLMKVVVNKMISRGYAIDSRTGNVFVKYYSLYGSLREMEAAYEHMKRSRCLIQEEGIRAMAVAYIKEKKFYMLGEFLRNVGLGRRNVGNLLWNLLLLSYAANFKMKSLQREFLKMVDSGFVPDITTFNIRMIAFSKMSLLWDLHISIEHMNSKNVVPDLVTYGCIVDAYMERRLGRNLDFALRKMNMSESPLTETDPLVFDVLGKGEFHLSAEAFLEFSTRAKWSYKKLVSLYAKKQYRKDQIFWNY